MIARSALLLLAFVSAAAAQEAVPPTPAPAPLPVGPDAVWAPAPTFLKTMHKACDKGPPAHFGECFVAQMKKAGASEPALAFARRTGNLGYLVDYRDAGKVDVGHAEYPFRANQNQVCFLVNGDPPMIDIDDLKWIGADALASNPVYADLVKRFPNLTIFPGLRFGVTAPVAANLKNGGQRFVADFLLRDGCRACTTVGSMKVSFDFDVNGKFIETQVGPVRARR
jgi:hypothetical protein